MLRRFRMLGFVEGSSLLLLLLVAMPLKYLYDMPEAVRWVGSLHGALFVVYVGFSLAAGSALGWSARRIVASWIVASIPLGPWLLDDRLFGEAAAARGQVPQKV